MYILMYTRIMYTIWMLTRTNANLRKKYRIVMNHQEDYIKSSIDVMISQKKAKPMKMSSIRFFVHMEELLETI